MTDVAKECSVKRIDDSILVKDSNGCEKKYDVLFEYEDDESGKTFVVSTEYKVDKTGSYIINVFYYTDNENNLKLVKSKRDKKFIDELWSELQNELNEGGAKELLEELSEEEISTMKEHWINVLKNMDKDSWISLLSAGIDKAKDDEIPPLSDFFVDDIVNKYFNEEYLIYQNELIGLLRKMDSRLGTHESMGKLGKKACEHKDFATAEMAFKEAENWNNLAFLIRRGEVADPKKYSVKYVAEILKDGVHKKETFSMINMALLWALNIGGDESWKLADKIMSFLSIENVSAATFLWENVAKSGDVEGYLVHYWILKYEKLAFTTLGEKDELLKKIRSEIPELPAYI